MFLTFECWVLTTWCLQACEIVHASACVKVWALESENETLQSLPRVKSQLHIYVCGLDYNRRKAFLTPRG